MQIEVYIFSFIAEDRLHVTRRIFQGHCQVIHYGGNVVKAVGEVTMIKSEGCFHKTKPEMQ